MALTNDDAETVSQLSPLLREGGDAQAMLAEEMSMIGLFAAGQALRMASTTETFRADATVAFMSAAVELEATPGAVERHLGDFAASIARLHEQIRDGHLSIGYAVGLAASERLGGRNPIIASVLGAGYDAQVVAMRDCIEAADAHTRARAQAYYQRNG